MDGGAWWTAVHGVTKSQTQLSETKHNTRTTLRASLVAQLVKNLPAMQETWVRSLGWEDSLKEGVATHSTILAWRIPMDGGAWRATFHGVTKSQTRLSD